MFDILAVIGAVTGSAAALAQIASFWRDRARLDVDLGPLTRSGGHRDYASAWLTTVGNQSL